MPNHLSPASLVYQRGAMYPNSLLTSSPSSPLPPHPYANLSANTSINLAVPQIFVVNPTSDNIFLHVNSETAHAAIIGLIYSSMWMGALGWDIVSTISFDIRVIKETTWSSSFSSIYSIAYLLSRYVSLSWLVTAVTNSVIMTNHCDAWMKGSTALFSTGISATMLVFCLRTCSIWHMKQKVVSLVVSTWLLVVAFGILLPVMSYGSQLPTSNFCSWHFNGFYVVGVFGSLLIFDLVCLVLTVCKLNKAGWRGLLCSLFPSSRHNLDAEDVKTVLVQKTTAFFAIQFLFLISALLVYVLTDTYAYRLMNLVASNAVASSMAGRIFRRAWRQTRELAPHNVNRPPSYFLAWAEEHRDSALSANDIHSVYSPINDSADGGRTEAAASNPTRTSRNKDKHDSLAFYVEGEFRPQNKARTLSDPSLQSVPRTPTSLVATHQIRDVEAAHASIDASPDILSNVPSTMIIARNNLVVPSNINVGPLRRDSSASQGAPAPAYSRRLGSASSSRPHTSEAEVPSSSSARRPNSAGDVLPPRRGSRPSVPNMKTRLDTAVSQSPPVCSFLGSPSSPVVTAACAQIGLATRDHDQDSDDQHEFFMEEKRRTFVTSPPLSAGVRLNSKEVYDVDSVKAAARFGPRQVHLHKQLKRPATASPVSPGSAFGCSGSCQSVLAAETDPLQRGAIGGSSGPAETAYFGFLRDDPLTNSAHRNPRPRTAPDLPSPSLSASESVSSHRTLLPRDAVSEAASSDVGLRTCPSVTLATDKISAVDDNALLAFRDTVEQDSRDRIRLDRIEPRVSVAKAGATDEARPRTSRGNTACSTESSDSIDDQDSLSGNVLGFHGDHRGRRASTSAHVRPGVSSRDKVGSQTRASTSAGARGRLVTGDGGSSANRPSTAVGEGVKPFGFSVLASSSRPGSLTRLRSAINDEEDEAEPELGSVIQKEYAKLAARAQMPLDPP